MAKIENKPLAQTQDADPDSYQEVTHAIKVAHANIGELAKTLHQHHEEQNGGQRLERPHSKNRGGGAPGGGDLETTHKTVGLQDQEGAHIRIGRSWGPSGTSHDASSGITIANPTNNAEYRATTYNNSNGLRQVETRITRKNDKGEVIYTLKSDNPQLSKKITQLAEKKLIGNIKGYYKDRELTDDQIRERERRRDRSTVYGPTYEG